MRSRQTVAAILARKNDLGRLVAPLVLVASGLALSGCMSSPTYGTSRTSGEQLVEDMSGIMSLKPQKGPQIDYKPRPDLVKPTAGEKDALPPPQDSIVASNSAQWPESPEQQRRRIRSEADANRDKPGFEAQVIDDTNAPALSSVSQTATSQGSPRFEDKGLRADKRSPEIERKEFKARLAENNQGSATTRKYLSEPPLAYRAPADTAPVDDIGEDELKKERRLKAAAKKKGGGWADLWPF